MNPLVTWFNQNHISGIELSAMEIPDETIIIGGGLASLDIAKIIIIENVKRALREIGIKENALHLEHQGIHKVLEDHGTSFEKLGLKGCRLITRHALGGMPLTPIPDNATQEEIDKAVATREKILSKVQEKFPFEVVPNKAPVDKIIEGDKLAGIIFEKTEEKDGKFTSIPDSREEVMAPLVISAIGSVPETIPGIPMKGEIYDVEEIGSGKIRGLKNVFALGNAVTGRGNIRQSMIHSRQVSENIVDQYLAWNEDDYKEIFDAAENRVGKRIGSILDALREEAMLSGQQIEAIDAKIMDIQKSKGFDGDYESWITKHMPVRIENMVDH
jgi:NADPH-dependent glutamate synthase beta subunit-like oxidoreductase